VTVFAGSLSAARKEPPGVAGGVDGRFWGLTDEAIKKFIFTQLCLF
jgi:hypothetical protein